MPDEAALKKARSRMLRLLGYSGKSRREAEAYLQRKGFDSAVIAAVLAEMERWGYIDDSRFTAEFIESCLRRGFGPLRARHILLSRGISRDRIEKALERCYSPEAEQALARKALAGRTAGRDEVPDRSWFRRQAAYLQRRGFHDQVIIKTLREHCSFFDD